MPLTDKSEITQGDDNLKGICGFVVMSQMIIDYGKITLEQYEKKYATNSIKFAKEWVDLQLEFDDKQKQNNSKEVTSLQASIKFTREFPGYNNFLNAKKDDKLISEQELIEMLKVPSKWDGMALVPEAIMQYLKDKYKIILKPEPYEGKDQGKNIAELWKSTSDNLGHGIYGLKLKENVGGAPVSNTGFKGESQVAHYVYIDKAGNLMTWGDKNQDALDAIIDNKLAYIYVKLSV